MRRFNVFMICHDGQQRVVFRAKSSTDAQQYIYAQPAIDQHRYHIEEVT